jgi:hypothetical protein
MLVDRKVNIEIDREEMETTIPSPPYYPKILAIY